MDEGQRVQQGELLATLHNVQLAIGKDQAESQLEAARAAAALSRAQLWEGRQQVEARILSLSKTQLQITQKKREAEGLADDDSLDRGWIDAGAGLWPLLGKTW